MIRPARGLDGEVPIDLISNSGARSSDGVFRR
ncbi:hypothetical protein LOY56_16890 [Pseudomonas sp. B21-048]|nr:hypothetical protein LOY56_16890 [Pseudomonas sp. B21-048]